MFPSAFFVQKNEYLHLSEWREALAWLENNSDAGDVVMCCWDVSPWVNYYAARPTAVNNQPIRRFDAMRAFFLTGNATKRARIIGEYNISYVMTRTAMLSSMWGLEGRPEYEVLPLSKEGEKYYAEAYDSTIVYDAASSRAWKRYAGGTEACFAAAGTMLDGRERFINTTGCPRYNGDYVYFYSDYAVHIPSASLNSTYLSLQFMPSMEGMEKVYSNGVVKVYKVKR
jgi:hypothetical protein